MCNGWRAGSAPRPASGRGCFYVVGGCWRGRPSPDHYCRPALPRRSRSQYTQSARGRTGRTPLRPILLVVPYSAPRSAHLPATRWMRRVICTSFPALTSFVFSAPRSEPKYNGASGVDRDAVPTARERAASDESALRLTSSDESEPAHNTSSDESVGDRRLGSRLFRRKRDVLHLFRRKCTVLSFVLIGVLSSRPQDLSTLPHLPARPPDGGLLGVGSLSLMRGRATRCIENESQQTLSRVDVSEAPNERKAAGGPRHAPV